MLDILIKDGQYPDFNGSQFVEGDIGIKEGKIVNLGKIKEEARLIIDAKGKVVSPGFIDIHMHEENFTQEGEKFVIADLMLKMGVTTGLGGNCGVQYQTIQSFKESIHKLGGSPINYLMMAGYNAHRDQIGVDRYKKADKDQIIRLIAILEEEIRAGACGFSFGLEYSPGIDIHEIMAVLDHFPDDRLMVSIHYRADADRALESIKEMVEVGTKSKKKLQISHLSSGAAMGQMEKALDFINQEIQKNPKLNYDTYPYDAFSTMIGSAVFDEGCFERWGKDYDSVLITDGEHRGKRCTKELFEKLRVESPDALVVVFGMNESEIRMAIANKEGMVASDGIISGGKGHPRASGTFPRLLGKYVREEGAISLIEALKKITLTPAKRLNLENKGRIEIGCDADITIFDKDTIMDGSDYKELDVLPKGIDCILVGGQLALDQGKIINGNLGRFIAFEEINS